MTTTSPILCGTPTEANAPAASTEVPPRRFVYCVLDGPATENLGPLGVDGNAEVFAIPYQGTTALVSATSAEKLEITRGNALSHQRVMEAALQRGHTVLPVRFNTIADARGATSAQQRIIDHVLAGRRDEILGLLSTMRSKVELGVKGLWTDLEAVFRDIVQQSPEIQSLREKLLPSGGGAPRRPVNMTAQIKLGEKVKRALEARKRDLEAALLDRVRPLAVDVRTNKTFGDPMFANLALLVDVSRQAEVEAALTAFEAGLSGQGKLRCVGPLPPCNFVELVITWDD